MIWERAQEDVIETESGYLLFDDSVVDKDFSHSIELVRKQYSGNARGIIKGIGVVTCVYVNSELNEYWIIDMRIYAPEQDGKSKIDHVKDMIHHTVEHKKILFRTVLMDSWYSTKDLIMLCESHEKIYYCPIKRNRKVDDSGNTRPYERAENLTWSETELEHGKIVKLNKFPKDHKVKLLRVSVHIHRTEYVITNDKTDSITADDARSECAIRWKIEQLHREAKQLTGIEKCQCRKARIQRNHILCAWLVWPNLARKAKKKSVSMYKLKETLINAVAQKMFRFLRKML